MMYFLTTLSAVLLLGFIVLGIVKFGLQSCYSAYGMLWKEAYPPFNIWSVITFISAALMIPVLLEAGENNPWQFLGFLAPVSLFAVAISPDYKTNKTSNIIHQCGAWCSVVFILSYLVLIPKLAWLVLPFLAVAVVLGYVFKGSSTLWMEIAAYLSTYTAMYMII